MALLQALFALITKSAGKILNAVFGWAVHALFGKTAPREQTILSALVGAAVAWPLLALGVAAPKIAALVLAFVPLPRWIPSWSVRLVWLVLALAVPVTLGLVIASRRPPHMPRESVAKRILRGFPLTLGLALAFIFMFVSVPVMRLISLVRREKSVDVPLVTDADAYHEVAARIVEALNRHGFGLRATEPGWWVKAPTRILALFGGKSFEGMVPASLEHYVGGGLEISFYTSGILVLGKGPRATFAHGLIAETAVHSRGLSTFSPAAQELERRIRRVWSVFDDAPHEHRGAPALADRVQELARELGGIDVDYDEWQALYRQALQVERAVRGERQLLDDTVRRTEGGSMSDTRKPDARQSDAQTLSTTELVREATRDLEDLVKSQLGLVKAELRADLKAGTKMATGLGVAALAALIAVTLLLVTAILALSAVLPAWLAGLVVSGAVIVLAAVAGAVGWRHRVRHPLERSRRQLKEDVTWTKERTV